MATRRDELSAHTFARKRTLAAFLQPESRVSDEEAPRPVRAVMPSVVMSVVLVAGCIAWGAIAPSAPPKWDAPGEHIIVDSDSTTRYVVLPDPNKKSKDAKQLHPVLNFASAKLVLDKGKGEVIEVAGKDIDESSIARGATIGIPYAPDRLPSKEDAESPKEWGVCEKPAANSGGEPQQGVFVLGGQDAKALQDKNRLRDGEALYVEDSKTGERFIVDGRGTKLPLHGTQDQDEDARDLLTQLVLTEQPEEPQQVTTEWLKTLNTGAPLVFTNPGTNPGSLPGFAGLSEIPEEARHVGMVMKSNPPGGARYYLVMKDRVQRISPLVAKITMGTSEQQQADEPVPVQPVAVANVGGDKRKMEKGPASWPDDVLEAVNRPAEGIGSTSRTVSCSVYTGEMSASGKPELAAWAGKDYPANIVAGSNSAYVSSGSGLLFQEVSGSKGGGGTKYLLTDSGLRYALRGNSEGQEGGGEKEKSAQSRLGYEKSKVAQVPFNWASLLPKGPSLDSKSASQEQGL